MFGPDPIDRPNLVVRITLSRRPLSAFPMIVSEFVPV